MRNNLKIYKRYLTTPGRSILQGGIIAMVLLGIFYISGLVEAPGRWMVLPVVLVVAAGMAGGLLNYLIFPFKYKSPQFRFIPKLIGGVIYVALVAVALVIGMNGAG
jgi:hypothetical protein